MVRVLEYETIQKKVIENMKQMGTYRKEYRDAINIYADMMHDYMLARRDFEESGRVYETQTAAGNPKKSGIVDTIEKLRRDLLQYSDRLGLNPKSLETITAESGKKSVLADVLNKIDE